MHLSKLISHKKMYSEYSLLRSLTVSILMLTFVGRSAIEAFAEGRSPKLTYFKVRTKISNEKTKLKKKKEDNEKRSKYRLEQLNLC